MRCYICNRVIDEPHWNSDHQDYDPCDPCRVVIEDLLASYKDQTSTPDEVTYDPSYEEFYPTTYDPFETENSS